MRPLLLSLCTLWLTLEGQQLPVNMIRLTVRIQSPDIPENSFAAKPKVMYRAGTGYCRIEEMPDPDQGIHGLSIINEPDVWMVNLMTKSAQHFVDAGPTFNCRLPLFTVDKIETATDARNPISDLEFGRELAYFKAKSAVPRDGPVLRGKSTKAYMVEIGDSQLHLFTTGTPERPTAVARQHGNSREILWYGDYEELPFDAKLFAKPEGVRIEEAKQ